MVRTASTAVWFLLVAATAVSWFLGTDHDLSPSEQSFSGAVILVVAIIKVRLVGTYFMELRNAPGALRSLFGLYCLLLLAVLLGLYLW